MGDDGRRRRDGVLAWIATVAIGVSWQLATRLGVSTTLSPIDLALLRYTIPALVLLPMVARRGFWPKDRPTWTLVLMVLGGGLPFGLLGMAGAQLAPVSHMGALLPGSMPVFVALLCFVFLGERFGWKRRIGLLCSVVGVGCIVGPTLTSGAGGSRVLIGDALFLSAGAVWAVYTVAFRASGLDPWHGAGLICFWSSVLVVPSWCLSSHAMLLDAPLGDIALQVFAQGLLAGLVGLAAYGAAIRHLGASVAAVSGAAVPGLTALGGVLLLGEPLGWWIALGLVCVTGGIWAYSGAPGQSLILRTSVARASRAEDD